MQGVIDSFYVDDFSGGANSLNYVLLTVQLRFIDGAFNLSKWRTNEPNFEK